MAKEPQIRSASEIFQPVRQKLDEMVSRLTTGAMEELSKTEEFIRKEGLELQRLLLQARLHVLFERERVEFALEPPPKGVKKRVLSRQIESQVGTVVQWRHGLKKEGESSWFPMNEQLNLPADRYTHPLRRRVVEEVADGSFDRAVGQIERTTAGHVPKRQAQQLTVRATQDVEGFYEQRAANDVVSSDALLVMSSDGCAIRMVRKGLREPTRLAAEKAEQEKQDGEVDRGDPTKTAMVKPHRTRRAMLTGVWEQERHSRTVQDVVANLQRDPKNSEGRKRARGPRPQNKRLTASVEQELRPRIVEMFDEADRRDPRRQREAVVLVDGDEHQTEIVKQEAERRQRPLTLVLDLLHAMHYLWLAAKAIGGKDNARVNELVTAWTIRLLTGEPHTLVATIRGTATRERLQGKARGQVDTAADYLLKRTPFLKYADFIARGLPIASGVIEGACRHIVRDRLDITGARWDVEVAEAVLKLRAVRASGDWDQYWEHHQRQEALRNYDRVA